MLRSRENDSFSEAGMLDRKKGLPELFLLGLLFCAFSNGGYCNSEREGKLL